MVTSTDSIPNKSDNVKKGLSTKDSEYISAVKKGDTETAQRIVDEAAKKNGYTQKVYHGTKKPKADGVAVGFAVICCSVCQRMG